MEWSSINCWLRALRNLTNFDQQLSPLRNVRQIGTKPSGSQVHWSLFSNLCFYPHENSFRLCFYTSTLSYVGTLRAFGLEVFTQVFLFFFCLFFDCCVMIQLVKMGGSAARHHYGDFVSRSAGSSATNDVHAPPLQCWTTGCCDVPCVLLYVHCHDVYEL